MSNTPEYLKVMDDRVREIGKHLGMELDEKECAKERYWNYLANLKNGNKVICLSTGQYKFKDRWHISGSFPRDNKNQSQTEYNVKLPDITVAMNKTPEKVAKDIKARLLPKYEAQLAKVLVRIESSNKYHADKLACVQKIAGFLNVEVPTDDYRMALFPQGQRGVYKIEPYSDGKVKFDVEVDADKAIEILKILGYGPIKD